MTGGQPVDGDLTVPQMARQLQAKGCTPSCWSPTAPTRLHGMADMPHGVPMRHRDELDVIQRELRTVPGVSA
jgi:indolepyruvate ferredoxin oxidoreductase